MKRKNIVLKVFLDTETENGFDGYSICSQYIMTSDDKEHEPAYKTGYDCLIKTFSEIEKEKERLEKLYKNVKVMIFIHNATFDMLRFKEQLTKATVKYSLAGSNFIRAYLKTENLEVDIRDTLALLPASLAKLAESFKIGKKLEHDHNIEFDIENGEHIEYALNDVIILKRVVEAYANILEVEVEKLKVTTSATALHEFKKIYKEKNKHNWIGCTRHINEELSRNFYFGGRVIMNTERQLKELNDVISLDITSSYPASMNEHLYPISASEPVKFKKGFNPTLDVGRWLAYIKVYNYQSDCPILPNRTNGLKYPMGTFESVITDIEYKYLINKHKNLKIEFLGGYFWNERKISGHLKDYINKWYTLKKMGDELNNEKKGSGEALRTVAKLLLNGLYGKFAQKYDNNDFVIIGQNPEFFDYDTENKFDNDHRYSAISCFVTAASRVKLYQAIDYYKAKNVMYCDTDSIKVLKHVYEAKRKMLNENEELGGWKNEGEYEQLHVHAPKVYSARKNGNTILAAKGIKIIDKASIAGKIVCNKNKPEIFLKAIRDSLIENNPIEISYPALPVRIRTHNKTGELSKVATRTLTKRENVKGYFYNEKTDKYENFLFNE